MKVTSKSIRTFQSPSSLYHDGTSLATGKNGFAFGKMPKATSKNRLAFGKLPKAMGVEMGQGSISISPRTAYCIIDYSVAYYRSR